MNKRSGSILSVVFHDEERPSLLPVWFRRDGLAVVPVNTPVVPLFHYVRDSSKIIYADEPVLTELPWVMREIDVYKAYDVLYYDCVDKDLDGLKWLDYGDLDKWVAVLQLHNYVHDLQGREFVGFNVQIADLRPYTG